MTGQADLLELIATDWTHRDDRAAVINAIQQAVTMNGVCISSNDIRPYLPLWVYPKLIGATVSSLVRSGVLSPHGWVVSDDVKGGNAGRPARTYIVDRVKLERLT